MAPPQIAILGAGIFVKTDYLPALSEITHLFLLKSIWSRTEASARGAVDVANKFFPGVECKWGDEGFDDIIQDPSIVAVLVVLAAQVQVDLSLKLLKAGKHVIQAIGEAESALSRYNSLSTSLPYKPIWAVAENFCFEPAIVECTKIVSEIGDWRNFQITLEYSMDSSSPYFSTPWRHDFIGGFVLDIGVHFVAMLRMIAGCEVTSVSAATSHVNTTLPPPDIMSSVIQLENGCCGVMVIVVSAKIYKNCCRIVGSSGTLQIECVKREGKYGFLITLFSGDGQTKSSYFPMSGVTEELKTFLSCVSQPTLFQEESKLCFVEGARDVAVLDAILDSGKRRGALVGVKKLST